MTEQDEAADPNTPVARLLVLFRRCPEIVLENAALPLLLIEQPTLVESLPQSAWYAFAASPYCSMTFVKAVLRRHAATPHLVRVLVDNPALPVEWRRKRLLADDGAEVPLDHPLATLDALLGPEAAALVGRVQARPPVLLTDADYKALLKLGARGAALLLRHPLSPGALLATLFDKGKPPVRALAAKHPNFPRERLAALVASADEADRLLAATSPNLTEPQFQQLVQAWSTRRVLFDNKALPGGWFAGLAR